MASVKYGSLPFKEQIAFWHAKELVPTERWNDLTREQQDAGFMVAGAMQADLLADLYRTVDKVIAEGVTLAEFRQDFDAIVAKRGWTGWTGWTGEGSDVGRAWRTRVIYETNLHTSYQAGRWAQVQAGKAHRPYLIYRHSDTSLSPRPLHVSWDGVVVRIDDPWVQAHWPPNGWGCKCRMFALSDSDLQKLGKSGPDIPPDDGSYDWVDPKTGEVHTFPKGIDPFWDYAPGRSRIDVIRAQMLRKAEGMPLAIGEQLRGFFARSGSDSAFVDLRALPVSTIQDIAGVLTEVGNIKTDWLPHGITKVVAGEYSNLFAATDSRGYFILSTAEIPNTGGRSGLTLTLSAFAKIKAGQALDFPEEYALETLWHEIGHNRQAHVMLDSMTINQRMIAEALRQTLARQTYPEFLAVFGKEPLHLRTVRESGLSYTRSAGTFKNLLLEIGAMDTDSLAISPDLLADLSVIDSKAEWDRMLDDLIALLSNRYPDHSVLISSKLKKLSAKEYD